MKQMLKKQMKGVPEAEQEKVFEELVYNILANIELFHLWVYLVL